MERERQEEKSLTVRDFIREDEELQAALSHIIDLLAAMPKKERRRAMSRIRFFTPHMKIHG